MSVFKLPSWVIKEIHLVARVEFVDLDIWVVGGILNLHYFNRALLGKWWWKISSNPSNFWSKNINADYSARNSCWILYQTPRRNVSFQAGISSILPSSRSCLSKNIGNGATTSLWFDKWFYAWEAPKDLWLLLFNDCNFSWIQSLKFWIL